MKEPTPWKDQLNSASNEYSARISAIVNVASYGMLGASWFVFLQRNSIIKFEEGEDSFLSHHFTLFLTVTLLLPVLVLILDYLHYYAAGASCEHEKEKYNKAVNKESVSEAENNPYYDKKHWGYIWSRKFRKLKQVLLSVSVIIFGWFIALIIFS